MERKSSDTYNLLQTDISQCCYRCIPISLRRLRTWSSLWARLDWHHNSSLLFPAPNAPLAARISPVGFHRTKESCQRPWQRVTSPSATAVMFRLLLTHSPFFPSPSLSSLWFEQETFSLSILSCHFFKHTYQSWEKRRWGGDRCFSYAFLLQYNEALEREKREEWKDICRDLSAIHILSSDDWQYIICIDAILNFNIACQKVQNDRS